MNFLNFKKVIQTQFTEMSNLKGGLFVVDISGDELWDTYLSSFREKDNPVFKTKREYDCNCCRKFIKTLGGVVAIKKDNTLVSLWDVNITQEPGFEIVASALAEKVKERKIINKFISSLRNIGEDKPNFLYGLTWNHFHVSVPSTYLKSAKDIDTFLGETRQAHQLFFRGLSDISLEAIDIVSDLINQKSIYRGEEHLALIKGFRQIKETFETVDLDRRENYVWKILSSSPPSVQRIRNTLIGTLLLDIVNDVDLDRAVTSFETKAYNYKRPTPIITKRDIDELRKNIDETALARRFANLQDIKITNTLFVEREVKSSLKPISDENDILSSLEKECKASSSKKKKGITSATLAEVSIYDFITNVLPNVSKMSILFEERLSRNLVSLIAPDNPTSENILNWGNPFSWSYIGDFADSIKERVKKAGGNVLGKFCSRLGWYNYDDLDISLIEPSGYKIYFGNKGSLSPCGGQLDVDMNAGEGKSRQAVENIFYTDLNHLESGNYEIIVHNYAKREYVDEGFEVDIEFLGDNYSFFYEKSVKSNEKITVATFRYCKRTKEMILVSSIPMKPKHRTVWNLTTENLYPVDAFMLSPNHWDSEVGTGNKHYFFFIRGCKNDGSARGFYNEFLNPKFNKYRKAMELLGSKVRTEETDNQLSGLGFSSTQENSLVVKVEGNFTRMLKVLF